MAPVPNSYRAYNPPKRTNREPTAVKNFLRQALSRYGLDKQLARYEFVLHWKEVVGEEIAKRSRPECLKNGLLVVRVTDSAWAQELSFQRETILQRLRKYVSADEVLRDVYFYVAGSDKNNHPSQR